MKGYNTGDFNSGYCNDGDYNTGDYNTGDYNTGDWNAGDNNTGSHNTGNHNTGNWNAGNWNAGDYNKASSASGCFNTSGQTITMFNKPCDWTMKDWWVSAAKFILSCMPETNESGERQEWWDAMADGDVKKILALPNFDAEIFEECTGIRV